MSKEVLKYIPVTSIFEKIYNKSKDAWEKWQIILGDNYVTYMDYAYDKHSQIKTIFDRKTPKNLYGFFVPNHIFFNNKRIENFSFEELRKIGHLLLLTGSGGLGKTTMLKHIFCDSFKSQQVVPIFIELRDLNSSVDSLKGLIYSIFSQNNFEFEEKHFEYAMEKTTFLFLFDGLDEVQSDKQSKLWLQIREITNQFPNNYYVVSSRPNKDFQGWSNFKELELLPFSMEQSKDFIRLTPFDVKIQQDFIDILEERISKKYESFISNPLLLSIMILTFARCGEFPIHRHEFYDRAFECLHHEHDSSKGGAYRREHVSRLSYSEYKSKFKSFCFITYFKNQISFSKDELIKNMQDVAKQTKEFDIEGYLGDLENNLCMIYYEGNQYHFSHRSFQEFFTASYLEDLEEYKIENFLNLLFKSGKSLFFKDDILVFLHEKNSLKTEKYFIKPILEKILHVEIADKEERFKKFMEDIHYELYYESLDDEDTFRFLFISDNRMIEHEAISQIRSLWQKYAINESRYPKAILRFELLGNDEGRIDRIGKITINTITTPEFQQIISSKDSEFRKEFEELEEILDTILKKDDDDQKLYNELLDVVL